MLKIKDVLKVNLFLVNLTRQSSLYWFFHITDVRLYSQFFGIIFYFYNLKRLRYVLLNNTSLQITSETYKNLVQIAKDDLVVVEKIFYNLIIKEYGLLNYNATKLLRKSLENLKLNKLKEEFNGKNIIFIVQTDKYDDGINEQIKISIETTVRDYGVQQCKIIFIKSYIRFLLKSNNSNTKIGIDEFFYIIHNHLQIINIRDFDIIYFMNIHIH